KEVSGNFQGLNVVIYDPVSAELIDSLGFRMDGIRTEGMHADAVYDRQIQITFDSWLLTQLQRVSDGFRIYDLILIWGSAVLLVLLVLDLTASSKRAAWIETEMAEARISAIRSVIYTVLVLLEILVLSAILFLNGQGVKYSSLIWHTAANELLFSRLVSIELAALSGGLILMILIRKQANRNKQRRGLALSVLLLSGTIALTASFSESQSLISFFSSESLQDPLYEEVYVNPDTATIVFPKQKKNLIYLFLESAEVTAADYASGGGLLDNTIPELTELAETYDDFSGMEKILNGAVPLKDSTWTSAAMAAQTSGLPLQESMAYINNGIAEQMMPGAVTIGDLLKQNGYQNAVLMGSDGNFGNRNTYFTEHGNYEILDLNTLKERGWLPEDYKQNWGFEDSRLFEFAKLEAEELAASDQPFNLTLLTADTHYPSGYLCSDCPDQFAEKYANVTACSSKRIAEFVSWVQEQEWGKDTVIVINGDHCYMGTDYYDYIPHDYLRRTYTCIINSSKEEPSEPRTYSTMDLFPTTLSALGCTIPGGRLGLGTDLYSDVKTLLETNTIETLNHELSMHSTFYQKEILRYYTAHAKDQ
ncbi:MAG: LTA synthase family protein, partial [Stecheria intestinalis]|nr:LTA synthase family protein [Stecheria intestinalis]